MDKLLHQQRKNELRKWIDDERFDLVLVVLGYLFPRSAQNDWQIDENLLDGELIEQLRRLCAIKAQITDKKLLDLMAKICSHPKVKLTLKCKPTKTGKSKTVSGSSKKPTPKPR